MRVVHGLLTRSGLPVLWAETTPPAAVERRRSRRAVAHPFAVPGEELAAELAPDGDQAGDQGGDQPADRAKVETVTLLLPSAGSAPVASPELGTRPHRGTLRLRPWLVPVVCLPADADLPVVFEELAQEHGCATIAFLAELTSYAADLVGRGRVLPGLVLEPAGPAARWRPVLTGVDGTRLAALARTMPAACRAEQLDGGLPGGEPDAADPETLLHHALAALTDGLVRRRLRAQSVTLGSALPPPVRRHAPDHADTAVRRWLAALTGEARFDADPGAVHELARGLDAWQAGAAVDAPVRTCLRLSFVEEETGQEAGPETADGSAAAPADRWLLEFLMQPLDDPSVLVPAAQIWTGATSPLHRWLRDPQEQLLADLGRASRLFADLDDALRTPHPAGLLLDVAGAHRFLTHAPLLGQAGFGVLLPAWWQRRPELGLTLTVHSQDGTGAILRDNAVGLDAVVDYRWGLALGAEQLTEHEFTALARAKVPLVRLRGQWVYLNPEQLAAGIAFLGRGGSGRMSARDALRQARLRGDPDPALPLPVTSVTGDGWLGDLLCGQTPQRLELLEPPAGLTATLRPYQLRGLSWLAFLDRLGLGACLADDMGLGKTVQLLALETMGREQGGRPPTLLVCPLSVLGNWQREAARFTPGLRVRVHHGTDRLTGADFAAWAADCDLVLTTYALVTRDVELLSSVRWDRVVLDEAQQIKNSSAAAARAVRRVPARHRVALTGTPVENRLAELWSILDFVNPGMLGSAHTFRARYAVPIERHADEAIAARLRRVTRPFMLRRVKTDPAVITDLPQKMELKQLCNLTTEQATLYRAVVQEMFELLGRSEGAARKGLILAAMTKLKQVCNHPAQLLGDGSPVPGRSGKLLRLEEILDRILADGEKALVFTQFARFGALLAPHLAGRFGTEVRFLRGSTPRAARDAMVERFQSESGPGLLLLSLKAGGTGLNLTAANHVVHLDRWWNPAAETQATDRAFRIGQRRHVQVHKFVCIGTLEERIDRMIEEKSALAHLAVGSGEGWLGRLSTGDLRELVALSPEAVDE